MGRIKLLKASAGSGKTFRLAYEYVRNIIEEPVRYKHILAVTFTNKATGEMKRRILSEINMLAGAGSSAYLPMLQEDLGIPASEIASRALQVRTRILHDYSHFAILTIDKFFQRIIRSFIKELGIDLNFNLELQTESLLSASADMMIDEIPLNSALRRWIAAFVEEKIEEGQRWDIKDGLLKLGKEIFREEFKHYGRGKADKEELEKIVREATASMAKVKNEIISTAQQAIDIITSSGLDVSNFPYKDKGFANYFYTTASGNIAAYGKRVRDAVDDESNWHFKTSPDRSLVESVIPKLRPLLEQICTLYDNNCRMFSSVTLLNRNYRNFALLSDLNDKVLTLCAQENIMPISETNSILNKLIAGNDAPFIFEKAGNYFNRFMIDEFQDTSVMQWENFLPLLRNAESQTEGSPILMVGDVKQSIYRWRGGDWRILSHGIEQEFRDIDTYSLASNYRSDSNIVHFNNALIAGCIDIDNNILNNSLEQAVNEGLITGEVRDRLSDTVSAAYEGHEQAARHDGGKGHVEVTLYMPAVEGDEPIPPVIGRIEELQENGYLPGDIAILVRTKDEGARIARMLLDHKVRNPDSKFVYDVVTQEALIVGSAPVSGFIIACLRLVSSPSDTISRAVYNKWKGRSFEAPLPEAEALFIGRLAMLSPEEAFEAMVHEYGLGNMPGSEAFVQAVHEQIISFATSSIGDINLFLKWWDEKGAMQSLDMSENRSAITITTIHQSKGLQYKAVLLPYCNWEMVPGPYKKPVLWTDTAAHFPGLGPMPLDFDKTMRGSYFAADYFRELVMSHVDNMNLLYVAVTRAMNELHIMIPWKGKAKGDNISSLIIPQLPADCGSVEIGSVKGEITQVDNLIRYSFGKQNSVAGNTEPPPPVISLPYASYGTEGRLKLKRYTARYIEDGVPDRVLAPRNYGILMHRAFEEATDRNSIYEAVDRMLSNGKISEGERQNLTGMIERAFDDARVRSWFDTDNWKELRIESGIIRPGVASQRRPDRVMINGDRAMVVDYKFGVLKPASHRRQLREYMSLMSEMGYADIKGYIWYVSLEDIDEVSLSGN